MRRRAYHFDARSFTQRARRAPDPACRGGSLRPRRARAQAGRTGTRHDAPLACGACIVRAICRAGCGGILDRLRHSARPLRPPGGAWCRGSGLPAVAARRARVIACGGGKRTDWTGTGGRALESPAPLSLSLSLSAPLTAFSRSLGRPSLGLKAPPHSPRLSHGRERGGPSSRRRY